MIRREKVSRRFLIDIRKRIGLIQNNIDKRESETHKEIMQLKNFIDLKLHPLRKGYLRFQTSDGFVEFKQPKEKKELEK